MNPDQVAVVAEQPQHVRQLQIMQRQSQAYYDMSLLVHAVQALESWRRVEHEFAIKVPRPSTVPVKVRKALEEVKAVMDLLLGGILIDAKDGKRA